MAFEELKKRVCEEIDRNADHLIENVGEPVYRDPELGFKEFKTAKVVGREFSRLGLAYDEAIAVTGLKTVVEGGGGAGPNVAVIGELDSVLVHDHEFANPETGAAHCCGHNAQITTMLGVANGLIKSGVLDELGGRVSFMAIPAEEFVEIDYRNSLRREGKIEFLGGKSEMIKLGAFDDIDMAMMVHGASTNNMEGLAGIGKSNNGFVGKQAKFIGKAAHAGGAPHNGINSLYAAQIALSSINALRETFKDDDTIRIHPILTRGGDLVNVIPSDVRFETMVRGKTADAIADAAAKVDRALKAGALALGAQVEISTLPGYMPLVNDPDMSAFFKDNFLSFYDEGEWVDTGHRTGSTDMGDVSYIMPALHPHVRGFSGVGHGSDWAIEDKYLAYVLPAKLMAMTVIDLLAAGAQGATKILDDYEPLMSKDEYLEFMRSNAREELFDSASI